MQRRGFRRKCATDHGFDRVHLLERPKLNLVVDFHLIQSLDQTAACAFTLKPVIKLKHVEKG